MGRIYTCIDLKSFYASVECHERSLDPLSTNLVVADISRTDKTICLAVSPSLKSYGLPGRARLFEIKQKVREINKEKSKRSYLKEYSYDDKKVKNNKHIGLDFIIASPRMKYYMDYSNKIYNIYLKYVSKEDIFVYSIDECFIDLTNYLKYYKLKPEDLVTKMIKDVYDQTGITATAGIGTNLYLCKIAMDIEAKHMKANSFGVRIAYLDTLTYRKKLWSHKPITDFWRVGKGYAKRLAEKNIYTMGDIARTFINNEDILYKMFGVNAELLIDHAFGYEPCIIKDIKNYKPSSNSISLGQVLHAPYDYEKTLIIIKEMADELSLDLVRKKKVTKKLMLTIGYDIKNDNYLGETKTDHYGRKVPKSSHGTVNIDHYTNSYKLILDKTVKLYNKIINKNLLTRRINLTAIDIKDEKNSIEIQLNLFEEKDLTKEKEENNLNNIILDLKNKYGKNAIIKAMDLEEGSTTTERNNEIGGHRA